MDKALKTVGIQCEKSTIIQTCEGDIISISADGKIDNSSFTPDDYSFFSIGTKRTRYSFDWCDWEDDDEYCGYTDEEELLLDMCNCYGVDEEDVILLLDYGYTAMEIEDMFMDSDLLHSAIQDIKCQDYYDDFLMEV